MNWAELVGWSYVLVGALFLHMNWAEIVGWSYVLIGALFLYLTRDGGWLSGKI